MSAPATDVTEQQSAEKQLAEDPVDIITLLQKKIIHQSASIYNFLGALQQHAPPQPFILGEVLHPVTEHPEWSAITDTPRVLKEQMQSIRSLIDQLPPLQEEDEAMQDILALVEQSNQLDKDLSAELEKVEDILYQGQLSTAALSLHELQASTLDKARTDASAEPGSSAMQM
eukprot:jgi/Ulvmu1/7064/UM033_0124.1